MAVLGIDLGTSGCKTVLVARDGRILATATAAYALSTPKPLWSEQDPHDWWKGVVASVQAVVKQCPTEPIEGIGIGGQMHGATLLDAKDHVVRPAILWNDGRCQAECDLIHQRFPGVIKNLVEALCVEVVNNTVGKGDLLSLIQVVVRSSDIPVDN